MASANGTNSLTNYVSYQDVQTGRSRVGHYDLDKKTIQPLAFVSGTPLDNLYQVIEVGEPNIVKAGEPLPASSTKILPPFTCRDVLCVGKNYADHAKEFNSSGFDSSDKVDVPSHPVIFTKRFTSIIADGEDIFPHPGFTDTVDYEGEIGVVIGKPGFRISEADAMSHVWGYTIVNDVTARERQRDHKQFYIGKSADTFCPMVCEASETYNTHSNRAIGSYSCTRFKARQSPWNSNTRQRRATTERHNKRSDILNSVLDQDHVSRADADARRCSCHRNGKFNAHMTSGWKIWLTYWKPAGVGIGKKPPIYLKSGDKIAVSVTGLGTLTNRIAAAESTNLIVSQVASVSHLQGNNTNKNIDSTLLTQINGKPLHYKSFGKASGPPVVFVHGLGGSAELYTPLIQSLGLADSHSLHVFDLEGHGLSPTSPLSKLSIESFAADLNGVFEKANITSNATVVAHSMGCLVGVHFALAHPDKVSKLILIGPPPSPLPEAGIAGTCARAETVRTKGMTSVVDAVVTAGTSEKTKLSNQLAVAAVRLSLLGQDPEGYAKACAALAGAPGLDFGAIQAKTLIVTGSEDKVSPPPLCEKYVQGLGGKATLQVLEKVGHWHVFEDLEGVTKAAKAFL